MDAPRCVLSEMIKNLPLPKDTALFIVQILLSTYSLSKKNGEAYITLRNLANSFLAIKARYRLLRENFYTSFA